MSSNKPSITGGKSKEWIPALAIFIAMVMATGPGVLLVNRSETVLGLPLIYAWGILWYLIIGTIALLTDFFIWRHDDAEEAEEAEGKGNKDGK